MALKILNGMSKKCDYNKYLNLHQIYLVTSATIPNKPKFKLETLTCVTLK